ncbi:hypothetical protein B0H63DRAFT_59945 [Podospora didyma]|uniref:Uncharacterized protein n=1 Tax=Podospora didyma TaxID=330526 RepID=A0AAE0U8F0_9PEZI|nr:hypothetical protein B0H63DRAFT_59945 [Podospora didyma]
MVSPSKSLAGDQEVPLVTSLAAEPPLDIVETPTSPSSGLALSRFEFETGKGNEGTKILMVEWDTAIGSQPAADKKQEPTGDSREYSGDWEVSWEGKTTVLPIRDADPDAGSHVRRVYFLLPPGAHVPALVSIAPKNRNGLPVNTVLRTKPMPAIFPAELAGGQEAGRRGVLHTIWAKKRLAELQAEIVVEMKSNGESVGLEMAMQERQWIVDHFGLVPEQGVPQPTRLHIPQTPVSPTSPRSPIGGRLGEKLRGLKLATSPAELAAAATHASRSAHPRTQTLITTLSPNPSGVVVSSFASFGGRIPTKDSGNGVVSSLDTMLESTAVPPAVGGADDTTEEELFALPMSPRSPEMARSPFSML